MLPEPVPGATAVPLLVALEGLPLDADDLRSLAEAFELHRGLIAAVREYGHDLEPGQP